MRIPSGFLAPDLNLAWHSASQTRHVGRLDVWLLPEHWLSCQSIQSREFCLSQDAPELGHAAELIQRVLSDGLIRRPVDQALCNHLVHLFNETWKLHAAQASHQIVPFIGINNALLEDHASTLA